MKLLKLLLYPVRPLFGSGIGNVRFIKWCFTNAMKLLPKRYLIVETNGCKLGMTVGKGRGFDSMASGLLLGKGYEVGTTEFFKQLVKPNMNVVDVGAHIGYYTVLASRLVGNNGKVWAFEPEPRNYNELLRNIKLNNAKNVIPINKAIGDENKSANLYYSDNWSGECSLCEIKQRPKTTIPVQVTTLDDVIGNESIEVIKIDVDGGELMVLNGAKNVIRESQDIILFAEYMKYGIMGTGYTTDDYWQLLTECEFTHIYGINERNKTASLFTIEALKQHLLMFDGINLLCAKRKLID